MRIRQWLRDAWDNVFMPTEEKRGDDDSVKDLLRLKIKPGRSKFVYFMLLLCFTALGVRIGWLQLGFNTEFLQKQGAMRFQRTIEVPAMRGQIYDRNGTLLATSVTAKALWIIPQDVKITTSQLKEIAKTLDVPVSELRKKFNSKRTFVYLKRQVPIETAEKVLDMKIPGLHSTREFLRSYPDGEAAAQIVGLTGLDGNGIEGIELAAEKRLAGKPGSRRVMKDRLGRIVEDAWLKEPMNGENITLTIDSRLQNLAYEALGRQVENLKAKGGSIVIADPKTGDILALANYPSFDPNNRGKISRTGVRNRAIVDTYEPGSTMKPFSVAAGLEEKKVTPNTLFQIGRSMSFGRHSIGDSHYSKELTVSGIIQQSSNIGTSKVALLMTPQVMWSYYDKLGFGHSPQIGFPGAVAGRLRPAKNWRPIEQATMSYGHGVTVSLLQQVRAYTVFARDGDMIELSIYKDRAYREPQRVYSAKTAGQMRDMLAKVVEKGGTGFRARVEGYIAAGKTGTAQIASGGVYRQAGHQVAFCGYFPADEPKYSCIVVIRQPRNGYPSGGTMSGGVVKAIAEKVYASHMSFDIRDMEKDSLAVTLPQPKAGERGALEYVLDKLDIEADNDSIETQWVTAKREDGREDVELKDIPIREGLVPNVVGMGAKDAVYLLESVGLRASLNGMGRVSSQSVSPGSRVSKGQTVSLTLK